MMFVAGFAAAVVLVAAFFWLQGWTRRRRAQYSHSYMLMCIAEDHLHRLMDAPNDFMRKYGDQLYGEWVRLQGTIGDIGRELEFNKRTRAQAEEVLDSIRCSGCGDAIFHAGQLRKPFCASMPTRRRMVDNLPEDGIEMPNGRIVSMREWATVCSRTCADKVIATWPYIGDEIPDLELTDGMRAYAESNRYGEKDVLLLQQGYCHLAKTLAERS